MSDQYRRRSGLSTLPARNAGAAKVSSDNEASKEEIWSSLLDSVASSKKLPEKNLIVLGGTPKLQQDFIDTVSQDQSSSSRRPPDRYAQRKAPIANQFALGYTYHDVLDADHEDLLARISLHLLSEPSPAFIQLLRPLLRPGTIPATLIVILLDWAQARQWLRQLRTWLGLLRSLLEGLDNDCQDAMEELMRTLRKKGRESGANTTAAGPAVDGGVSLPLGPGDWDDPLGLPLCVVCHNADKMESLDKERNWRESDFDFVQQNLRTILLKHGGSLVYTSVSDPNSLQGLIHSLLGIQSLLKRQPLKPNIIDRDKILVPPNWDSWGKIRVLDKSFDAERVSKGWTIDLHGGPTTAERNGTGSIETSHAPGHAAEDDDPNLDSATALYEELVPNTRQDMMTTGREGASRDANKELEVETIDMQEFLAGQLEVLEKLREEEERDPANKKVTRVVDPTLPKFSRDYKAGGTLEEMGINYPDEGLVREHIGPVQFNVGGIQVDADDMLKRIASREADRRANTTTTAATATTTTGGSSISNSGGTNDHNQASAYHDPAPSISTPTRSAAGPITTTTTATTTKMAGTAAGPPARSGSGPGQAAQAGTTTNAIAPATPDHASTTTTSTTTNTNTNTVSGGMTTIGSGKSQNEALASFFAGLMKKADSSSNASSPSR